MVWYSISSAMYQLTVKEKDGEGAGLIIGMRLPHKYQTRLGVVSIFQKLAVAIKNLDNENKLPKKFHAWPVDIIMPCGKSHLYTGPDDFPTENMPCKCKNPKHRPVMWDKKASHHFKDIKDL